MYAYSWMEGVCPCELGHNFFNCTLVIRHERLSSENFLLDADTWITELDKIRTRELCVDDDDSYQMWTCSKMGQVSCLIVMFLHSRA